ncbi:MAG: type II methionyl aminopeptidase [Halobacteria archaeon]|nr:type II methionyl aminopeptidase [Halobacteria archaeon]
MTDTDTDTDTNYEKHREAGEILVEVREEAADSVEPGVPLLEVAETAEERIRQLGGEPAFPVNISRNEEAAHATPSRDDETEFGDDMVNLDIGVHVDGWIADSAVTVDMTGNTDLAEAPEKALEAAIDVVEAGVSTAEIGRVIEETINDEGFNPVYNLTGHGLDEYEQHTSPSIPNHAVDQGVTLDEGDVVAIEPFATDGTGRVNEKGSAEIYSLVEPDARIRSNAARDLLSTINDDYGTLPFAKRWLPPKRLDMTVSRLERRDIVHSYPTLSEDEGCLVSQAEHTVVVEEDGCEVITR